MWQNENIVAISIGFPTKGSPKKNLFPWGEGVVNTSGPRGEELTHYQTTNFRLFKTERVCRRQFQIDENGRKLPKQVENNVEKGEIARYEQFLLFPQCFQKACSPGASKGVIVWDWVNSLHNTTSTMYTCTYSLRHSL